MDNTIISDKIIFILCLTFLILSISSLSTQAIQFYADLEITVDNAGFVNIKGNTNYPHIIRKDSQEYTSKTQSLWTLNITTNITFSDFVYSVVLPEHTEIISVSSSGTTLIGEESGRLVVNGYGSNDSLSIVVQYHMEKILDAGRENDLDFFSIVLIIGIVGLIICFFIIFFYVDKNEKSLFSNKKKGISQREMRGLNDRQKKILTLLQESDVALTQTEIQRELNMPKASVSRNIRRLELKGLIEKERIGMSNLIRLKKS